MDHQNQVALAFKRRLKAGELLLGGTLCIPHIIAAKMMSRAGFDYVTMDMEHWPINIETLQALLDQFRGSDTLPIVRVASNDAVMVKHVLDAGARGVVFPSIQSPEEASQAAAHCFYPPLGTRGFGPTWATDFGATRGDYAMTANEAIFVVMMIEHVDAVPHAEAIAATDGVDALAVGPADLSASMGLMLQQVTRPMGQIPEVHQAMNEVAAAARRAGKAAMGAAENADPEAVARQRRRGFQAVTVASDVSLVLSVRQTLKEVRETAAREHAHGAQ